MDRRSLSLFSVFFVFFLDNFGFALAFPILSPTLLDPSNHFFSPEMSGSMRNILLGVMLCSFSLGQFFGAPIIGDLADSIGRKRIFYLTIAGTAFGFFLSAIAMTFQSYTGLLVSRFLSGIVAGNFGICLAAVIDFSRTEEEKGRYLGYIATIGGVSWIASMIINGVVANPEIIKFFSPAIPFWLCGILLLISLIFIGKFYEDAFETPKKIHINFVKVFKEIGMAFTDKETIYLFTSGFFWYLAWFISMQWMAPFYIYEYKATQMLVTIFLIVFGAAWTVGSCGVNVFLVKRCKSLSLYLWFSLIIFVGFVLVPLFPHQAFYYIFVSIAAFAGAIAWPNYNSTVSLAGTEKEQGKLMGINQGLFALGQVVAPIIGGLLAVVFYNLIFFAAAALMFVAFLIMLIQKKNFMNRSEKSHEPN